MKQLLAPEGEHDVEIEDELDGEITIEKQTGFGFAQGGKGMSSDIFEDLEQENKFWTFTGLTKMEQYFANLEFDETQFIIPLGEGVTVGGEVEELAAGLGG